MKVSRFASAVAAAAMLAAPVVAQAGTRASGSSVYATNGYSANRASTSVKDDNDLKPAYWVIILLAGGAAAYGISRAIDNKSSGAN
jgi:hypothetical protein